MMLIARIQFPEAGHTMSNMLHWTCWPIHSVHQASKYYRIANNVQETHLSWWGLPMHSFWVSPTHFTLTSSSMWFSKYVHTIHWIKSNLFVQVSQWDKRNLMLQFYSTIFDMQPATPSSANHYHNNDKYALGTEGLKWQYALELA